MFTAILAGAFVCGIILAMNEGYWFPIANFIGVLMCFIVVLIYRKRKQ